MLEAEINKTCLTILRKLFCLVTFIFCFLPLACPARAGTTWQQTQKLTASDGAALDYFGISVSISGDYAIVGAYADDDRGTNSGSAYIFKWDDTDWIQQQKLTASDGAADDWFGFFVSISGDYAIVGAYLDDNSGSNSGSAYIFRWDGTNWVQQQKLTASDGAADDNFGKPVSISSDYAIIGAFGDDDRGTNSGSAYIFERDGSTWAQQQKLTASDGAADDRFGFSVSISGNKIIVGAVYDDDRGSESGSAYIFSWDGTTWVQQAKLTASDGAADDHFGWSVSISGDCAIVGAHHDDDKGSNSGSAYIFSWDGTGWVQQQKLTASDGAADDSFGHSVSISGDKTIVGANGDDDGGSQSGSAYIFRWDGTSWSQQQKLTAADGTVSDFFGGSVSISSGKTIVGANGDDDWGSQSGSAYIFELTGTGTLTVLTPNGGEKLVAGSTYDITWDTDGLVEDVFIEYSENNGGDWTAITTVANTGSYHWLVPDANSSQCLMRISDADYPPASDVSDDVFRIYVSGILTVLSPNGGEKLLAGSTYDIIWDIDGIVEDVFIEYSVDNGQSRVEIDTVSDAGSYSWLVPEINSNQCLVWVSNADYPLEGDVSDSVFRIYVCADWLIGDLNRDCFVNFWDFAVLGNQWLQTPGVPSADIAPEGGDSVVNFLDLGILVSDWLHCGDPCDPNCQP